jgi:predicted nucleic acid-binding protein
MHSLIVRERGTKVGVRFLDAIYSDPLYRIIHVDRDLESQAVDNWLRKFTDARFSLTDASSFQIMQSEGIDQALALDHHFEIAGFNVVPSKRKRR